MFRYIRQTSPNPAAIACRTYVPALHRNNLIREHAGGRALMVGLLIVVISVLPRIPLSISIPDRRFDLRVEDLLVLAMLISWLFHLVLTQRMEMERIFRLFAWYLLIGACTSLVGIMNYGLNPIRAALYLMKDIEFGLIGLLVANWIRTKKDLEWVQGAFLTAVFANTVWMAVQVATGYARPLLSAGAPSAFLPTPFFEQYGPGLISEPGAFQTGQFFLFAFLLAFAYAQLSIRTGLRLFFIAVCLIAGVSIALSASRGAIFGALVGAVALGYIRGRGRLKAVLILVLITIGVGAMLDVTGVTTPGRFSVNRMRYSILDRIQNIWAPMLSRDLSGTLVGFGKGSLGFLPGMPHEYAHNQYLRVLIETGPCGLIFFVATLGAVIHFSQKVYTSATLPVTKCIAATTLAVTLARCVQALIDDVFMGVLATELWWVFVGLTVSASIVENQIRHSRLAYADRVHLSLR